MRRVSAWLSFSLCVIMLMTAIADAAQTESLIFLSTQLCPIEEAQKMRNLILKDFSQEVDYCARQERDLVAFAARAGYEVVGTFKETGSGTKLGRAERRKEMALAHRAVESRRYARRSRRTYCGCRVVPA